VNCILEFDGIVRAYRKNPPVLKGVSFSVHGGEVVGLLGRNGAGKTTLLRIAMGMLYPDAGSVQVFGLSPTAKPLEVKRRIGFVAEDQVLPAMSSIAELIAFHRYLFPSWDEELEGQILDRFSLDRKRKILQLSKGQARQVALLCAVCHRPELLILDEPAAGLDPAARREFLEVSIQLLNREGTTILFSSHYMNDVERIGGRVVLLDDGKVRLDSDLDRLREDFCIAMVPKASAPSVVALRNIPGCVGARLVFDDWHMVFQSAPDAAEAQLKKSLGANGIRCVRVPLEEMFVELVGGKRDKEA
jgi:ABC-2 type transport system ATP-binding protein